VTLDILNPNEPTDHWMPTHFTVLDPGFGIDIVVLAADQLLSPRASGMKMATQTSVGADCTFIGYPYGATYRARFPDGIYYRIAFTKHCTVSNRIGVKADGSDLAWWLDGINNGGFSGGPVLQNTGDQQVVFGVISGYHFDIAQVYKKPAEKKATKQSAKVPSTGNKTSPQIEKPAMPTDSYVKENSGLILAFDIDHAKKAIEANPIGPKRP